MANTRKLMIEIDRTLKKLAEGVEVFDSTWEKVYSAPEKSQKEKHEADLKKEIKKLQRFRDQIKLWIANTDVKDKTALVEARKLVETKMEQFKICERETKTKAYSKEGLAQQSRLDPSQQAKLNSRSWIQDSISQLTAQVDGFEADIERLQSGRGKRQNKTEIQHLEKLDNRHKWHIQKLEQITRLLDNDVLAPDSVDELKEDVEYYLEAYNEPDFMETYGEDDIYEPLNLESLGSGEGGDDNSPKNSQPSSSPKSGTTTGTSASTTTPIKTKPVNSIPVAVGRPTLPKADAKRTTTAKAKAKTTSSDEIPIGRRPSTSSDTKRDATEPDSSKPVSSQSGLPQFMDAKRKLSGQQMTATAAASASAPELGEEHMNALRMLENSHSFIPDANDSERTKHYAPRNPYPTHSAFPSTPAPLFDNPSVFEKFDTDTLFFIFYYQQGTYQQYLAARELKRQTWAYHKKYMTWFKRHEEPKVTCEEYEQGTYVYFDYETGWCQRIKSEFTFEYSYLEDDLAI